MSQFDFNAPQYVDFTSGSALDLNDYADDYFDMDHEVAISCQEQIVVTEKTTEYQNNSVEVKEEIENESELFSTPLTKKEYREHNSSFEDYNDENKENCYNYDLRRSLSADNIALNLHPYQNKNQEIEEHLCEVIKTLELSCKKKRFIKINGMLKEVSAPNVNSNSNSNGHLDKPAPVITTTTMTTTTTKSIGNSMDNLHAIKPNPILKKKPSVEELNANNKYVSTAEYVNKFFRTPDRFHTKPKNTQLMNLKQEPLHVTVPQSPMLNTKARSRPVYYTSHEEQEKKVAEAMKKYHIKPHPINYKILNQIPALHSKVEKKEPTKPEPFKITETKTHKPPTPKPAFKFHAQPIPNFSKLKKMKQDTVLVVNENSNDNKVHVKNQLLHHGGVYKSDAQKPIKTKLMPFSFEERNKRMLEHKEQKIKEFLEEEKKKRQFHATPVPGVVQSRLNASRGKRFTKSNESLNTTTRAPTFKARPATVVHKEPFIPKKQDHVISVEEFSLTTERRAKERAEFEKKLKEKEEELEMIKRKQEELKQKEEEEEIARLRREATHKANPVRQYKKFEVHGSDKKLTSPSEPSFVKRIKSAN